MLEEKVDFYFYYDLLRMSLKPLLQLRNQSQWPDVPQPTCDVLINRREPIDADLSRSPDFEELLREEAKDFHGKYGEFVVATAEENAIEPRNHSWRHYQDIAHDMVEIEYMYDKRRRTKLGTWYFQEPVGEVITKAADEEGEGDEGDGGPAYTGIEVLVFHVGVNAYSRRC